MPIPRLKKSEYRSSEEISRLNGIIYILRKQGYDVDDAKSVINVIDTLRLDKSQFNFPYDSYAIFKQRAYAGEFDVDINVAMVSEEHCKELDKAVKEGKLWVTY